MCLIPGPISVSKFATAAASTPEANLLSLSYRKSCRCRALYPGFEPWRVGEWGSLVVGTADSKETRKAKSSRLLRVFLKLGGNGRRRNAGVMVRISPVLWSMGKGNREQN